jgi:hypothetical protein
MQRPMTEADSINGFGKHTMNLSSVRRSYERPVELSEHLGCRRPAAPRGRASLGRLAHRCCRRDYATETDTERSEEHQKTCAGRHGPDWAFRKPLKTQTMSQALQPCDPL